MLAENCEKPFTLDINPNTQHYTPIIDINTSFITQHSNNPQNQTKHLISTTILKQIIQKLPNNKASGPDNICNKIIKILTKKAIVQLMQIINAIFKLDYFLKVLKKATIYPILKLHKNPSIHNHPIDQYPY